MVGVYVRRTRFFVTLFRGPSRFISKRLRTPALRPLTSLVNERIDRFSPPSFFLYLSLFLSFFSILSFFFFLIFILWETERNRLALALALVPLSSTTFATNLLALSRVLNSGTSVSF